MEQMTKVYYSVLLTYNNVADRLLIVGFMENRVALVQVSLLVLRFPLLVSFLWRFLLIYLSPTPFNLST
jgi:hypothetical protein